MTYKDSVVASAIERQDGGEPNSQEGIVVCREALVSAVDSEWIKLAER